MSESRGAGLFSRAQATKSTSIQHVTEAIVIEVETPRLMRSPPPQFTFCSSAPKTSHNLICYGR